MVKIVFLFFLFIISTFPIKAQHIEVTASTDTSAYLIGDYIYFTITISYDKNIMPLVPLVKDSIPGLEFITQEDVVSGKSNDYFYNTHTFIFSKYDSGSVHIPAITVYYRKLNDTLLYDAKTNEHNIRIDLVDIDPERDIKDIKEPITIPLDWKEILLWLIIIVIVLILLYYLFKKIKKRKPEVEKIELIDISKSPHEAALELLRKLEEKQLWQQGFIKEYHSEITGIIRKYFEERFEIPALESTTGELLSLLLINEDAKEIVKETENFLSNADLVKFAKFQPMNEINEQMMIQAYDIVNKTRQVFTQQVEGVKDVR